MAKQSQNSATNDIQNMFDQHAFEDVFKTWSNMNERLTSILVDAGQRSTKIASETAQEALSNLRDSAEVRDDPAQYGQAYATLLQKQMELMMRAMQSFGEVNQTTGTEAANLASEAGSKMTDKASATTEGLVEKASAAANKAA